MRSLLIGSDSVGTSLLQQVQAAGVSCVYTQGPIPWFPNGAQFDLARVGDPARNGVHVCEREQQILIPWILVFDVVLWDAYSHCWRRNRRSFAPYWVGPCLAIHQGVPAPDAREWQEGSMLEAFCGLAQYRELGSLRGSRGWHQASGQAYYDDRIGRVVAHCHGSPSHHHRLFVPKNLTRSVEQELVQC